MEGVWAGGDIISGATVISALGESKITAADMDGWLRKDGKWSEDKSKSVYYF
jgi:NADPH-dependent glutamate synthase beta subunit-like oxidoreductase